MITEKSVVTRVGDSYIVDGNHENPITTKQLEDLLLKINRRPFETMENGDNRVLFLPKKID